MDCDCVCGAASDEEVGVEPAPTFDRPMLPIPPIPMLPTPDESMWPTPDERMVPIPAVAMLPMAEIVPTPDAMPEAAVVDRVPPG